MDGLRNAEEVSTNISFVFQHHYLNYLILNVVNVQHEQGFPIAGAGDLHKVDFQQSLNLPWLRMERYCNNRIGLYIHHEQGEGSLSGVLRNVRLCYLLPFIIRAKR